MARRVPDQPLPVRTAPPITDLALLGDGHSAALVSSQATVEFWCPRRFDADSAFLRLLDPGGGHFSTAPAASHRVEASYLPRTNVHRVRMRTAGGELILTTAMPHAEAGHPRDARRIVRLVECRAAPVDVTVEFAPRFGYGAQTPELTTRGGAVGAAGPDGALTLSCSFDEPPHNGQATYRMEPGERQALSLEFVPNEASDAPRGPSGPSAGDVLGEAEDVLEREERFWLAWLDRADYDGVYRDEAMRSMLTLKLLQHVPSGAFVAAPTFGLPPSPGGRDNWDYRYTWLRDSAFIVMAFETMGYKEEALRFRRWLARLVKRCPPDDLRPMYRVDGSPAPLEQELPHLDGYLASKPVRAGNRAADQQQLDAYGDVMICFHRAPRLWQEEGDELWEALAALTDHALDHWQDPGSGIWEIPRLRQWTYSKGMVWLALDRALEIAQQQGYPPHARWREGKETVRRWLDEQATDDQGAFKQTPDEAVPDGANLLFPMFGITEPDDPRVAATLERTRDHLVSHDLAYRFLLPETVGSEGAFLAVNFWMAESLANLGRIDEACRSFEAATRVASVLGLLPEEADPVTRAGLGNHPLGLSHYSLVLAAYAINEAKHGGKEQPGERGERDESPALRQRD